jgi:hypothetical protein
MSFALGNQTRLLVNTKNVSSTINGWTASHQRAMGEVTAATDSGARWVPGLMGGSLVLRGPQDSVDQDLHAEIAAAVGVDNAFLATLCPYGTSIGQFSMSILGDLSEHTVDGQVSSAVGFSMTASADESVDMGFLVHGLTAETADGNGTSVDRGASSATTGGGVATLHLTAYSGFTSVGVKIQHSTDNSSWSDLVSFASATDVVAERVFLATGTTINRYVRTVTDVTGTGSATFLVALSPR